MNCKRLVISGRVQGVGFRVWMVEKAQALGLSGWVRNRIDGSVEALVAGDIAAVEELLRLCRRGPRMAEVDQHRGRAGRSAGTVRLQAVSVGVNTSSQAARRAASASAMVALTPRACRLVTPCSLMPQGMMPV